MPAARAKINSLWQGHLGLIRVGIHGQDARATSQATIPALAWLPATRSHDAGAASAFWPRQNPPAIISCMPCAQGTAVDTLLSDNTDCTAARG
jgi:hypothetical protein